MTDKQQNLASPPAHTPGPWCWFGNARNNDVYLATAHSGRLFVMGFQRWGMRRAQPTFQPAGRGMVPASDLFTFEVGSRDVRGVQQAKDDDSVYRLDINGIDCPDAHLIAAAPMLFEAALDAVEALKLLRVGLRGDAAGREVIAAHIDELQYAIARARGQS